MGLFDKVFGAKSPIEQESLSKPEAFMAIALAVSAADGHVAQSEMDGLASYVRWMRMFETVNDHQLRNMFDKLIRILKGSGPSGLVSAAKGVLSGDMRETAFACAVDIALADGVLEEAEKQLLTELQQTLEVPENIAITIIQVMIIKNRG